MGKVLRIVQGNTFGTAIEINAVDAEGHAVQDFSLDESTSVRVWYVFAGKEVDVEAWSIDDGKVVILWDGRSEAMRLGTYDIFIEGMFEETAWRNAMKSQFTLVKYNYEAYIPDDVIVLNGIYQLTAQMSLITRVSGGGGGTPSQTIPLMDGEASVGEENAYARGDHRHPSDTSKQDVIADLDAIRSGAQKGATAYQKPTNGIPSTDMAQAVQTSLGKADTAYQKPANGIPATDLASAVQTSLGKADTAYQKPSSGIPATDLASAVQTSLGKADTSIQSVKVNGTALTPDANKAVDVSVPTVIDSLSSASTTAALSANQGKVLDESKQDVIDASHKLPYSYISGTPTIPSALSDLSDDSTHRVVTDTQISTWDNKANKVLVVNHGTDDTTYSVTPNVLHIWGTVASLTLTLATPTDNTIVNEYMIEFTSGSTATTLSLPSSVEWGNRDPLTGQIEPLVVVADATYQISIVNNIGLWTAISNS